MTTPAQRRLLDRLEAAEAASPLREGREIYVPMVELREVLQAAEYGELRVSSLKEELAATRSMLQKYMAHVAGQEGTDFTEDLDVYADWTDEEAATMQALSGANQQARRPPVVDDLYVTCPRCSGRKQISVITEAGTAWSPTVSEYVDCPVCCGTGEAERGTADAWLEERRE